MASSPAITVLQAALERAEARRNELKFTLEQTEKTFEGTVALIDELKEAILVLKEALHD